jgi:sugar phosphate isomerase/epimerase
MRLGIGSYTFVWAAGVQGYPQPAAPLTALQLLTKASALGVRVVQIADNLPLDRLLPEQIDELAAEARARGIQIEVGTRGIKPTHLRTFLKLAQRLGSPILRTLIDSPGQQPSLEEAVAALRQVLPAFRDCGVRLAIENHDRFRAATLAAMMERLNEACPGAAGICLDTANSLGCGEDVFTVLGAVAPWVVNVHIKDFTAERLPHNKGFIIEGCPAGRGAVDLPRLFAELRRLPQDPNIILELWPPPEPTIEESIAKENAWTRQSIDYLRQFVEEGQKDEG